VNLYGDMLFDFCESILLSSAEAQYAFRSILKEIRKQTGSDGYHRHERAWVLKVACEKLRSLTVRSQQQLTSSEQVELDAQTDIPSKFQRFDRYFRRLMIEDQILLLFRDKYGLQYPEIASAMTAPEGSLKVRRQQAIRTLEEWLWDNR
jgi:DNA-directed RNA polymerase specialized sigma24 family protein